MGIHASQARWTVSTFSSDIAQALVPSAPGEARIEKTGTGKPERWRQEEPVRQQRNGGVAVVQVGLRRGRGRHGKCGAEGGSLSLRGFPFPREGLGGGGRRGRFKRLDSPWASCLPRSCIGSSHTRVGRGTAGRGVPLVPW